MEKREWNKYAKDYHENIMSPLRKGIRNPLFSEIRKLKKTKKMAVADIGTGIGDLLPFLAEKFKSVYAIDFSKKMVDAAKKKHSKKYRNIRFIQADMRELEKLKLTIDAAIAVNSILHPSFLDVKKSLEGIYSSLKKGGVFMGVFPSMEAILYNFMLVYESEFMRTKDEKKAITATKRKVERRKYDFIRFINNDEGEKQRFYFKFGLQKRMAEAGFKKIRIKKVLYPWKEREAYGIFSGKPKTWDWYVAAVK